MQVATIKLHGSLFIGWSVGYLSFSFFYEWTTFRFFLPVFDIEFDIDTHSTFLSLALVRRTFFMSAVHSICRMKVNLLVIY